MSISLMLGNLWARISNAVGGGPPGVEEKTYATGVRGSLPTNLRKEEVAEKPPDTKPLKGQEKA